MKFVGDGRAANLLAALDNQRFVSCLSQIEGGNQAVVPATDNDNIALARPALVWHVQAAPFLSFRISSAAKRPLAPIIPPPGCVADPHM